jgi:hypothetical protein
MSEQYDTSVSWMGLNISKIYSVTYIRHTVIVVDSSHLAVFLLFCDLCNF